MAAWQDAANILGSVPHFCQAWCRNAACLSDMKQPPCPGEPLLEMASI